MTQGRKTLRSIRVRREATNGTPAVPRFIWRGNGDMIQDGREVVEVEEQVGIDGGTNRTYIPKQMATLSLAETEATYEQLAWLLQAVGLGTVATGYQGSAIGVNGSSVWHLLAFPTATTPPTASYTFEAGDPDVEVDRMPYGICTKLSLKGGGGEAVKVSAEFMGRYSEPPNAEGTFSAAGTLAVVETILAAGSAWLTPSGGAFGTGANATPGNILGFAIDIERPWEPKFAVDSGTTYFHTAVPDAFKVTGELTFEHQKAGTFGPAGSAGQMAKFRAQDAQLLRLQFPGGTISGGTANFERKLLQIDLPIKYTSVDALGDQNGNSIRVMKWVSKYDESTPAAGRGTVSIITRGTSVFDGA